MKELAHTIKQATHIPMLVKVFELTDGDVLELGTGFFSTTVLKWLCEMANRTLYSYESSEFWYNKAKGKQVDYQKLFKVNNFDEADIERHWSMAFIDHSPDERRWKEIKRLANHAEYIVIHDSNLSEFKDYGYEKIWSLFRYRYDFKKYNPNTTVVSNFHDLKEFYE